MLSDLLLSAPCMVTRRNNRHSTARRGLEAPMEPLGAAHPELDHKDAAVPSSAHPHRAGREQRWGRAELLQFWRADLSRRMQQQQQHSSMALVQAAAPAQHRGGRPGGDARHGIAEAVGSVVPWHPVRCDSLFPICLYFFSLALFL